MPEPLVPEPLLPEPEVWASTKGAVTTSTARAVTTILLNLLNISMFSNSLYWCSLWVPLGAFSLHSTERGNGADQVKEQFLCHGHAQASAWAGRRRSPPAHHLWVMARASCSAHACLLWNIILSYFESRRRRRLVQAHGRTISTQN